MKMSDLKIMKMKPQIIFLLVLAVSFQSISSVTDIHQSHQSGVEHLEFEHDHENHAGSDEKEENLNFDCHHCCHCHGSLNPSLLPTTIEISYLEINQSIQETEKFHYRTLTSRLLRPPPN